MVDWAYMAHTGVRSGSYLHIAFVAHIYVSGNDVGIADSGTSHRAT